MTTIVEEKILAELQVLRALVAGRNDAWVPGEVMCSLLNIKPKTLSNYVCSGMIIKKRNLYSWRSYLEFCGVYKQRGGNHE